MEKKLSDAIYWRARFTGWILDSKPGLDRQMAVANLINMTKRIEELERKLQPQHLTLPKGEVRLFVHRKADGTAGSIERAA